MAAISFFNSKEYEWSDVKVTMDGADIIKCTGIEYTITQKKEHLYAAGNMPIGIQSGNKELKGTLTLLTTSLDDLKGAAIAAGASEIMDLVFDLVISYAPSTARDEVIDVLVGCQISEEPKAYKQGDTHAECKLPFLFLKKV
jgi:hypothetical protein